MSTIKKTPVDTAMSNEGTSQSNISDTTSLAQRRWGTNGERLPKWTDTMGEKLNLPDDYCLYQRANGRVTIHSVSKYVDADSYPGDRDENSHLNVQIVQNDTFANPRIRLTHSFVTDYKWEQKYLVALYPWEAEELIQVLQTFVDYINKQ